MRIDAALTPVLLRPEDACEKCVVVIDVLRASTTLVTALTHGARKIVPFRTVDEVQEAFKAYSDEEALRCGERGGKRIPGFELGNSPTEYREETVSDRILLFTSTNGSQLFDRVRGAEEIVVGGFVNRLAVLRFLLKKGRDCLLACAGSEGRFSLEDAVCAGLFVNGLVESTRGRGVTLGDEARAAFALYGHFAGNVMEMIQESAHGATLSEMGMGGDLPLCIETDVFEMVPILKDGALVAAQPLDA